MILYGILSVKDASLPFERRLDRHRRRAVADRDQDVLDAAEAALVAHGELGRVGAVRRVGVRGVRGRGVDRAVGVEVPGVGDRAAVGIARAGRVELHRERREAAGHRGRGLGDRGLVAGDVVDAVDARVGVVAAEARAPLDHVQRAVRTEVEVHRAPVAGAQRERVDRRHRARRAEVRGLDPAVVPLGDEPLVVVERRELALGIEVRVEVVARAAHRRAAGAEVRPEARVGVARSPSTPTRAAPAADRSDPCCSASRS